MKKRWIVTYIKPDKSCEKVEEVKNMTEAITTLKYVENAYCASFTAAKNPELTKKITISKKMAMAAYLCGGEYKLPVNCVFGPEWV